MILGKWLLGAGSRASVLAGIRVSRPGCSLCKIASGNRAAWKWTIEWVEAHAPMPLKHGGRFDNRYEMISKLGEGGMEAGNRSCP